MTKKKLDKKVLTIKYNVEVAEIDKYTREVKKSTVYHNLVVNVGLQHIANLLGGLASGNFSHIALGTDATSPVAGDTSLLAEVIRNSASISSPGANQVRFEHVFSVGSGVSHAVREVAISDSASASGEIILSRSNVVNTLDTDTDLSVKVTYTIS